MLKRNTGKMEIEMELIYSKDFKKVKKEQASISIMDRGFLYGDSIYEAVRTYNGKPFLLDEHFRRMKNSALRLSMEVPFTQADLKNHIEELIKDLNFDCYARIIVTRGKDDFFNLYPETTKNPSVVVVIAKCHEYPKEFYEKGLNLSIVSITRNLRTALDPEIKSGNYLNNVLAIMEAKKKGSNDALMVNQQGFITECTTSNIFSVKDGRVFTPSLDSGILHGVTRQLLIKLIKDNNIPFEETIMKPQDIYSMDECFLTASTKEVMPVQKIDDKIIGKGLRGPITAKLMEIFKKEIKRQLAL